MKKHSLKCAEMFQSGSRGNGQFRNFTGIEEVEQAGFDAADKLIRNLRLFERQSLPSAPRKQSMKDVRDFGENHR